MAELPAVKDHGQSVMARISTEVVRTLKESFGKGPVKAKSYLLDDFLLVVMRGGITVAEQTMLQRGHGDMVREFRQTSPISCCMVDYPHSHHAAQSARTSVPTQTARAEVACQAAQPCSNGSASARPVSSNTR